MVFIWETNMFPRKQRDNKNNKARDRVMADLKSKKPAQTLNLLGAVCPSPIIETKKEMKKLPRKAILKIVCDLPALIEETIPRYVEMHGYQLEIVRLEDKGYWEIYIQKT